MTREEAQQQLAEAWRACLARSVQAQRDGKAQAGYNDRASRHYDN
jgi:hypothetical protein